MKNILLVVLTSSLFLLNFVLATPVIQSSITRTFLPKCVNNNWTFLYNDYRFIDIISTYESNPSVLVSMNDISSGNLSTSTDPSNWDKVNFVLNLKESDIRKFLTGPFITSSADRKEFINLLTTFKVQTGTSLRFVLAPRNTPMKILQMFSAAKVAVLYQPTRTINYKVDFNTYSLQDVVMVDLSVNALDLIVKMGKYLDKTEKSLFSLRECLNITPTDRKQSREIVSTSEKVVRLKRFQTVDGYTNEWSVRRDHVLEDSVASWSAIIPATQFLSKFSVNFQGERGIDAGGLTKEWMSLVTKEGFGNESRYFNVIQSDSYYSMPKSNVSTLEYYRFLGAFLAKVIVSQKNVQCSFPDFLLKRMMGKKANFHDLQQIDPQLYNTFKSMTGPIESGNYGSFTYLETNEDGSRVEVELIENGADIDVSNENKFKFMALRFKVIVNSPQIEAFVNGFRELIMYRNMPIEIFRPEELREFITGPTTIDVADWKRNTQYGYGYSSFSQQIIWFWEIVESMDQRTRRQLLRWVTGSSTAPVGGFSALSPNFRINYMGLDYSHDEANFPHAHTCFNSIDLPAYNSKEVMRTRLLGIIEQEGFGFG